MKKRDAQITVRLPRPLRNALEDAAMADGDRGLSGIVRRVLIDYAAKFVIERGAARTTSTGAPR